MQAKGIVNYYSSKTLPWIEVAQIRGSLNCFPKHYHDDEYSVGLIDRGAAYCLGRNENNLARAGESVLINPGQVHTGMPAGSGVLDYRMIYFDKQTLQQMVNEYRENSEDFEFSLFITENPHLHASLNSLAYSFIHASDSGNLLERDCLLHDACMQLANMGKTFRSTNSRQASLVLIKSRELLSSNLEKQLSLESIACELGVSRFQFLRSFKKQYGITPHVYRTQCRLEKAAYLLRKSHSLTDTAFETGFSDQSHLNRTFKNFFGATPGQYAECRVNT